MVRPLPWDQRDEALAGCGLLVNTTQLGQAGKPALDLALDRLTADAVVYDLVYAPLELICSMQLAPGATWRWMGSAC